VFLLLNLRYTNGNDLPKYKKKIQVFIADDLQISILRFIISSLFIKLLNLNLPLYSLHISLLLQLQLKLISFHRIF
jgi:hypothetical protein